MNDISIHITLGDGRSFGINDKDELVVFRTKKGIFTDYIVLGKCTKPKIEELKGYLDQLSIHAK